MGARVAVPLGVLLPCLAVSLVASGAVAVGMATVSGTSGYLMRQTDDDLLACAGSLPGHGLVAAPGSVPVPGQVAPGACGIELLSAGGQLLVPAASDAAGGPVIPPGRRWLAAHLAQPVTVPGAGTSGRWRVVITVVRYQLRRIPYVYGPDDVEYVISGPAGRGRAGLAAVTAGLAGVGQITGRVTAGYAVAAGAVLVLLAGSALAGARAILRPLRQAAGFAGTAAQAAVRGPPHPLPHRSGPAGPWPSGMTLMKVSGQLRASRAAEAAARRSADEMAGLLGEVSLELRTSVNVVRGFAQYCLQRGTPPPAGLARMMRRIAEEAARMDTLTRCLEAHSAGSGLSHSCSLHGGGAAARR
jgi:signal transduction histidine kinase